MASLRKTIRALVPHRGDTVRLWALGVSAAVHLLALTALGTFHFSRRATAAAAGPAEISVHTLERVMQQPEPKPKPKIEPLPTPAVRTVAPEPPPAPPMPDVPVVETVEPVVIPPRPVETQFFFGAEITARRVCYVVDGSGSMFGLMYLVRQELRESILNLSPDQAFNVVFFMQHGRIQQAFDGRLETATPAAKAEALNLLGRIRPEGRTSPAQGLEAAMRMRDRNHMRPEVIFFLTDGFDLTESGGGDTLVSRAEQLRKTLAPAVVVHTIGIYPAQSDGGILSRLAGVCGGRYIEVN